MSSIKLIKVIIAIRNVREWIEKLWDGRIISSLIIVFHVGSLDVDYCIIIIHFFHRKGSISEMSSPWTIHVCIEFILTSIIICNRSNHDVISQINAIYMRQIDDSFGKTISIILLMNKLYI